MHWRRVFYTRPRIPRAFNPICSSVQTQSPTENPFPSARLESSAPPVPSSPRRRRILAFYTPRGRRSDVHARTPVTYFPTDKNIAAARPHTYTHARTHSVGILRTIRGVYAPRSIAFGFSRRPKSIHKLRRS